MIQEVSTIDDLPATNIELEPEKIEDGKDGGPLLCCDLYDTELVHKIAQIFIPGLATACVDNTSSDIFKTPASVAVDVRKEMVEYITVRSESFVAESVILEGGQDGKVSDHPYDIISDLVDDFASSKRNFFSRVSGWLLSENREDKIDDFVQEMEVNGFWLIDKREIIAHTLVKNVDLKNEHHCNMKFHKAEELAAHISSCSFRSMSCTNEGCNTIFCASHLEEHDAVCPFKVIPCEQNCCTVIMRREMDRHCITVCPMKLVSCPFYAVGCQSPLSFCKLEEHRSDDLDSHVLLVLQILHKNASIEDLKVKLEQLRQASSVNQLAEVRDVRSLTSAIRDLEAKLGSMEVIRKQLDGVEAKDLAEEMRSKNQEVRKQFDRLEEKHGPREVSNKTQDDVEVKTEHEDVCNKPKEDLEAKSALVEVSIETKQKQNELSTPAEDLEAKTAPKEINCSLLEDLEAIAQLKEVSKPVDDPELNALPKKFSSKPAEDLEAKPQVKEFDCTITPEYEEMSSKEASSELRKKEVSSDPHEEPETKLGTNEQSTKASQEFETEAGRNESG